MEPVTIPTQAYSTGVLRPVDSFMRPSDATGPFWGHRAPLALGASVSVGADEVFVGIAAGAVVAVLERGEHRLAAQCDAGWFMRRATLPMQLGGSLGALHDGGGRAATIHVYAQGEFEIVAPDVLLRAAALEPPDPAALAQLVQQAVLNAIGQVVADALGRQEWTVTDLLAPLIVPDLLSRTDQICREALEGQAGVVTRLSQVQIVSPDQQEAPTPNFGRGKQVTVVWTDGNRYVGFVQRNAPGQVLILFAGGAQHWVPAQYVAGPELARQ